MGWSDTKTSPLHERAPIKPILLNPLPPPTHLRVKPKSRTKLSLRSFELAAKRNQETLQTHISIGIE